MYTPPPSRQKCLLAKKRGRGERIYFLQSIQTQLDFPHLLCEGDIFLRRWHIILEMIFGTSLPWFSWSSVLWNSQQCRGGRVRERGVAQIFRKLCTKFAQNGTYPVASIRGRVQNCRTLSPIRTSISDKSMQVPLFQCPLLGILWSSCKARIKKTPMLKTPNCRGPKTHPKSTRYPKKTPRLHELFRKVLVRTFAFFPLTWGRNPTEIVQKTCSDELFILGLGLFRVDYPFVKLGETLTATRKDRYRILR